MSVLSEVSDASASLPGDLLTTGQASRLCTVDPRTIARWADSGLLRSHRTAGGRRRILRSDLLDFMRTHGMPMPATESPDLLRIAVIDDEKAVVRAILRMLAKASPDAECRSALDGFAAGALLTAFHPDLVFLDVVMPGLSGVEVCEHIRSKPELHATSIVIVSGHLTGPLRSRLTAAGADRFIEKPFTLSDIASAVSDLGKHGAFAPGRLQGSVSP
jgi:excisionase family DNA binding protein